MADTRNCPYCGKRPPISQEWRDFCGHVKNCPKKKEYDDRAEAMIANAAYPKDFFEQARIIFGGK